MHPLVKLLSLPLGLQSRAVGWCLWVMQDFLGSSNSCLYNISLSQSIIFLCYLIQGITRIPLWRYFSWVVRYREVWVSLLISSWWRVWMPELIQQIQRSHQNCRWNGTSDILFVVNMFLKELWVEPELASMVAIIVKEGLGNIYRYYDKKASAYQNSTGSYTNNLCTPQDRLILQSQVSPFFLNISCLAHLTSWRYLDPSFPVFPPVLWSFPSKMSCFLAWLCSEYWWICPSLCWLVL